MQDNDDRNEDFLSRLSEMGLDTPEERGAYRLRRLRQPDVGDIEGYAPRGAIAGRQYRRQE